MDEVQAKRETVVITKHGKLTAKLVPADKDIDKIYNFLRGTGTVTGDVIPSADSMILRLTTMYENDSPPY